MSTKKNKYALIDQTITYTGNDSIGFWAESIYGSVTATAFELIPNVKFKHKLAGQSVANLLQAESCGWSEAGDVTVKQKSIEVCSYKINTTLCEDDFEGTYLAAGLPSGSNKGTVAPVEFQDFLKQLIIDSVAQDIESKIWNNDTSNSPADCFDGLLVQFDNDTEVIDVAGTPLSASNIMAEMAKVYAKVPAAILNKEDFTIFISESAAHFFEIALMNANTVGYAVNNADLSLRYGRAKITVAPGLPDNIIVAARSKNFKLCTDMFEDLSDVIFHPMFEHTVERTLRISAHMKIGVGYAIGKEIVYYS